MPEQITISKEIEFDAGHRVPNHKSKCRNPHGHRYRVRVYATGRIIETPGASDEGMLVDFSDLKALMTEKIHDVLDHGFIIHKDDKVMLDAFTGEYQEAWKLIVFDRIPTAENIAIWCYEQLVEEIQKRFGETLWLDMIKVWETPTSTATYMGPNR